MKMLEKIRLALANEIADNARARRVYKAAPVIACVPLIATNSD